MPRLLKYLLYAGFFFFSFFLFVYWFFPVESLKSRITLAAEHFLGPDYQVQIGEMDVYRLTGVALKTLAIKQTREGKSLPVLQADRIRARVGIFSLLLRRPNVSLDMRLGKGRLSGRLKQQEEGWLLEGNFSDLNLKQVPYLRVTSGLDLTSSIQGKLSLLYNQKQPLRTEGKIRIAMDQLALKESTIPLGEMGTFPLPALQLAKSTSVVEAEINKGSIRMEKLVLNGGDLQLDLKGRVFMAPSISHYRVNLQGDFHFSPKLWGVLDPILPEPFAKELQKQKGTGDRYPLSISGQLANPQIYSGALRLYPFKPF